MNTDRPNFEALYKAAYRKHQEMLNEIDDLIDAHGTEVERGIMTGNDAMGMLRRIYTKYTTTTSV